MAVHEKKLSPVAARRIQVHQERREAAGTPSPKAGEIAIELKYMSPGAVKYIASQQAKLRADATAKPLPDILRSDGYVGWRRITQFFAVSGLLLTGVLVAITGLSVASAVSGLIAYAASSLRTVFPRGFGKPAKPDRLIFQAVILAGVVALAYILYICSTALARPQSVQIATAAILITLSMVFAVAIAGWRYREAIFLEGRLELLSRTRSLSVNTIQNQSETGARGETPQSVLDSLATQLRMNPWRQIRGWMPGARRRDRFSVWYLRANEHGNLKSVCFSAPDATKRCLDAMNAIKNVYMPATLDHGEFRKLILQASREQREKKGSELIEIYTDIRRHRRQGGAAECVSACGWAFGQGVSIMGDARRCFAFDSESLKQAGKQFEDDNGVKAWFDVRSFVATPVLRISSSNVEPPKTIGVLLVLRLASSHQWTPDDSLAVAAAAEHIGILEGALNATN